MPAAPVSEDSFCQMATSSSMTGAMPDPSLDDGASSSLSDFLESAAAISSTFGKAIALQRPTRQPTDPNQDEGFPKQDERELNKGVRRGMMLLEGRAMPRPCHLSAIPETHPVGVLDSFVTILTSTVARGAQGLPANSEHTEAATTQLPENRTTVAVALFTHILTDYTRYSDRHDQTRFDPMATMMRGTSIGSNACSTVSDSRDPGFSRVGQQHDTTVDIGPGPYFGPPPMIELVKHPQPDDYMTKLTNMCECCDRQSGAGEIVAWVDTAVAPD